MTRLPRSGATAWEVLAGKLRLPPWHVVCISLGASGCFYFGPIPYEPEDAPPEVVSSSFPDDGENVIDLTYDAQHPTATLFVAALDDGGEVRFFWSWGNGEPIYNAQSTADESIVEITLDEDIDGDILQCVVSDLNANTVTLQAEIGINRSALDDEEGA